MIRKKIPHSYPAWSLKDLKLTHRSNLQTHQTLDGPIIAFVFLGRIFPGFKPGGGEKWCDRWAILKSKHPSPLQTNEYRLEINGWKMIHFLSKWSLFWTHVNFHGGKESLPTKKIVFSIDHLLNCPSLGKKVTFHDRLKIYFYNLLYEETRPKIPTNGKAWGRSR